MNDMEISKLSALLHLREPLSADETASIDKINGILQKASKQVISELSEYRGVNHALVKDALKAMLQAEHLFVMSLRYDDTTHQVLTPLDELNTSAGGSPPPEESNTSNE